MSSPVPPPLAEAVAARAAALMPYQADARHHWFDSHARPTAEAERLLRFVGWMMAQSVYNRSSLQVRG